MHSMTIKKCASVFSIFCIFVLLVPGLEAAPFQLADKKLEACVNALAKKHAWENAASVDKIECHNKGITSLDGVEQFKNVVKLSFHKNDIKQVKLSNLLLLREINLARNKIQTLELANFPQLKNLYFFGNRIPTLSLNALPSLEQIKGNSSEIVNFEYHDLPKLEKIYLFDNEIETLDIYHLPAMKYMDVRQNPMPDKLYEDMDKVPGVTILHDGNAEDWQ